MSTAPTAAPRPPSDSPYEAARAAVERKPLFTSAEVAEFERYEREVSTNLKPEPPPNFALWQIAGRPGAKRPGIFFDRETIEVCLEFDRRRGGVRPALYEMWATAGKPTTPGTYLAFRAEPLPR